MNGRRASPETTRAGDGEGKMQMGEVKLVGERRVNTRLMECGGAPAAQRCERMQEVCACVRLPCVRRGLKVFGGSEGGHCVLV